MVVRIFKLVASWVVRPIADLIRLFQLAHSRRRALYEVRAARGITLLTEWLSPQQKAQFDNFRFFEVIGCDSGKSYRIQYGMSANVIELNCDGRSHIGWCFMPVGNLVPGDVMLAQKIALETDERGALSAARQFLVPALPSRSVIVSPS
jgi:hypothetical protein